MADKNCESKMKYYAKKIVELEKIIDEKEFENWSTYELKERADVLKSNYGKYEQKCMAFDTEKKMTQEEEKTFQAKCGFIDNLYIKLKSKIEMRIDFLNKNPEAQEVQKVKADKENLCKTTFAGSINNWFVFYDEMKTNVCDNANLNDEQKMSQLVKVCTPELLNALKTVGFTDSWKKLVHTYNDKYKLTKFYVQKLFNLQKIDCPSSDNIKRMLGEINEIKKAFERIGDVTEETMMVCAITSTLDKETNRAWQRYLNTLAVSWADTGKKPQHEHMPSLESLLKFLKDECDIYMNETIEAQSFQQQCNVDEASNAQTSMKSRKICNFGASTSAQANESEIEKSICVLCNIKHPLFHCPKFKNMQLVDRVVIISEHNLCIRCFRPDHKGPCSDKQSNRRCERCKPNEVYHNSTICPNNVHAVRPMVQNPKPRSWSEENWD